MIKALIFAWLFSLAHVLLVNDLVAHGLLVMGTFGAAVGWCFTR